MKESLWRVGAATAMAAAALTACGGGGGDGGGQTTPAPAPAPAPSPAPAPAPAPGASDSASACVNEADFNAGTVLDYDLRSTPTGGNPTTGRLVVTTGAREAFAGANPVAMNQTTYSGSNALPVATIFKDLIDGNVVRYGQRSGTGNSTVTTTEAPAVSIPLEMQPGQTIKLTRRSTSVSSASTSAVDVTEDLTYVGRETLQSPVGTFSTCRFSSVTTTTPDQGSAFVTSATTWIAAEGPYRGQMLKTYVPAEGNRVETTSEVTRMTYTPQ